MLQRWKPLLLLPFLVVGLSACGNAGGNGNGNGNGNVPSHGAGNPNGNGLAEQGGNGNSAPTPTPINPVTPSPTQAGGNTGSGLVSTVTILDVSGNNPLPGSTNGLFRLTGQIHDWTTNVSLPGNAAGAHLVALSLTVVTAGDDLRGDGTIIIYGDGDADAIVHFQTAGDIKFVNINNGEQWDNYTTHTVALHPVPAAATVGDIQTLTIHTNFGGGMGGDNWDVSRVTLVATIQQ